MNTVSVLNRISLRLLGLFGRFLPKSGPLGAWTSVRTAPKFARKGLKDLLKEDGHV
jgi:L-lactate dehydrogenase complex protein LldF